jgi:predicted extracellular nuclease
MQGMNLSLVGLQRSFRVASAVALVAAIAALPIPAGADTTAQTLPFSQNWTNTGLITTNDDWSGVPGVVGYRGDGLTSTGTDPQTILADGSATPVDVNANQTSPNTFITGGVAEFHIADPTVALQGSGTADAPHIVLHLDTTDRQNVVITYNLRDIDGSADNAVQQVALQYRVGSTGSFTNVPAGYVADATTGPSLATLVTPVSATLPAAVDGQPVVEVRVMTSDAAGSDEWVGIDDITVSSSAADAAPVVSSTTPSGGAAGVVRSANITIDFSEPVAVTGSWFSISCATSGSHAATASGGPQSFTLDPDSDFAFSETCTVTIFASQVTDQDASDPPDNMASNHVFSFTVETPPVDIHQVQGASHISPLNGTTVSGVEGIVTWDRPDSFYMQDPTPDADEATSEGILVFGSGVGALVEVGDDVRVGGRVVEFRPGGSGTDNLTTTEITTPNLSVTVLSSGNALPAPTVVGTGGRVPPSLVIEDDATGNVEESGVFDPAQDGIDFYESLEGMRVQINDALAVGPTNAFGEIPVVGDDGVHAGDDTVRNGIVIRPNDFNPERIILDDTLLSVPVVNVGDGFTTPVVGVMDYSFANFKLNVTSALTRIDRGLEREQTRPPTDREIVVGTYNVENLDPGDSAAVFARHADLIVDNLRSPDLLAIEEIQDNDGPTNSTVTDASLTWDLLISAIQAAGGPVYEYRQIDPVDDQDGGQPGANIRVGFLFRTDRGLTFIDRPGGDPATPTMVLDGPSGPRLSFSPGRVDPEDPSFVDTRKSLAGEFRMHGRKVFVVVNHFSSKGDDDPLFGRVQPPVRHSEVARHGQAQVVNDFVDEILAADPDANVIVLGDINDFDFSQTVDILEGGVLTTLMDTLPQDERYSYVFEGNSQVLDQILVSDNLLENFGIEYDPVHVNSEFADQASDHDPQVARLDLRGRPTPR